MYAGTKAKASEIADAAVNTQAFTKGAKAIQAGTTKAKAGLGKAQGIAGGLADDTMKAIKANPTKAMGVGAAALLAPSLLKATMQTQQMYTYEKNPDGSFDLKFKEATASAGIYYIYINGVQQFKGNIPLALDAADYRQVEKTVPNVGFYYNNYRAALQNDPNGAKVGRTNWFQEFGQQFMLKKL